MTSCMRLDSMLTLLTKCPPNGGRLSKKKGDEWHTADIHTHEQTPKSANPDLSYVPQNGG